MKILRIFLGRHGNMDIWRIDIDFEQTLKIRACHWGKHMSYQSLLLTKWIFFHWTPIDFEIEFASIHFGTLHWMSNMNQNSYSGKLSVSSNPSPRLTENLSFWQFLQFLAISALSADLALREADYRRKSLILRPKKVACSTSKNLRKPHIYPLLRSKVVRKQT